MGAHARLQAAERGVQEAWALATARDPDWIEPDPLADGRVRRYKSIAAYGGQVLRVIVLPKGAYEEIVSVFFDRAATRRVKRGERP